MHSCCLVAGADVEAQLEPYADYVEVPRYRAFLEPADVEQMAGHFGVPASDLPALAARMPEWAHSEGGVEDGRLFHWSTENPQGKFDWYEVGGRFDGLLPLRAPRRASGLRGWLGGTASAVNQAPKHTVDVEALLANPPAALLAGGAWHECPILLTHDDAVVAAWRARFAELFAAIGDDEQLTVVDLHS